MAKTPRRNTSFCTIIITHFAMNDERSDLMRESLRSLVSSTRFPYELIVVDNGGSQKDTKFLLKLVDSGNITTYIRNSNNMHFGYARDQAYKHAHGDYVCIADNDLKYSPGWLESCVNVLEDLPKEKIYTTPLDYPTIAMRFRYSTGTVETRGITRPLNSRAGSNCFVIRKKDYEEIGGFGSHRIAGSLWTNKAVRNGYNACIVEESEVSDMGLRRGYNLKDPMGVFINISNGNKLYFNVDEFRVKHPEKEYYEN